MSEVKLYVPLSRDVINRCYMKTTARPATTAEIMEAHPKCGECRHWGTDTIDIPIDRELPCRLTYDIDYDGYEWKDGLNDYCRHWEGKE